MASGIDNNNCRHQSMSRFCELEDGLKLCLDKVQSDGFSRREGMQL